MKISRLNVISLAAVGAMVALATLFYPSLPDPMPSHWNLAGEVDGWLPKPWGVWVFPLVGTAMWGLFALLPMISPKGFRLEPARRAYDIIWFVMICFMGGVQLAVFLQALGHGGPGIELVVPLMTGGLFVLVGNYLSKFPRNFFVGIRTPWTLASEEVWNRTHRVGGWIFMGAGVLIALSPFVHFAMPLLVTAVIIAALVPVLYSYLLYRRLEGFNGEAR